MSFVCATGAINRDPNYWTASVQRWTGQLCRYSDRLRAGRSGDRIPVGARLSAPVLTGTGVHPASCTMGTGLSMGKERPGRDTDSSLHLVPWSRKSRAISLPTPWDVRPVQSLSACTRVHFTLFYFRSKTSNSIFFFISQDVKALLSDNIAHLNDSF